MERKIEKFFLKWKEDKIRKPLLLFGLKQIGKTYTVLEFGRKNYKNIAYFNTLHNEELLKIFKKERSIERLVKILSGFSDVSIEKNETLIVFDNIEDEEIIKGVKLFGFDRNDYHVMAITSIRENLLKIAKTPKLIIPNRNKINDLCLLISKSKYLSPSFKPK